MISGIRRVRFGTLESWARSYSRFPPFSLLRFCEIAMNSPSILPTNTGSTKGLEPISMAAVCLLFLGFLGYMGFKNLPADYRAGGYATMNAVVGEWQAAGRPWHISFRTDKTMGMSSGSAEFREHGTRYVSALDRRKCHNQDEERQGIFGDVSRAHAKPI